MPPPRCADTDDTQQIAAQADVEDAVVVGAGDGQRLGGLRDAGVVDQHVDAAEGLHHGRRGSVARGLVGDVGNDADVTLAETRRRRRGLGAFQVEDRHAGALRGHHARGCETQAVEPGAAGDDGDLVFEKHALVSVSAEWGRTSRSRRLHPVGAGAASMHG
jgi:hypothetical protein